MSTFVRSPRSGHGHVAKLTISEAAAVLHTAPSTIRSWEQRLGYPTPDRSTSGRRLYDENEIALLADALRRGLSISSAIRQIREQTGSYEALLMQALYDLEFAAADAQLEAAIALRGVSRAFDDTVLAALDGLSELADERVILPLAVEWCGDRACWARRQVTSPTRRDSVIVDGSEEGTVTRAATHILQLQLALRSVRTHVLHAEALPQYRAIARKVGAHAVVFVGRPPTAALRNGAMISAHVAAFRIETDLPHPRIDVLPALPRVAAERLLAAADHDGAMPRM
jgi:DNA-binding transcriptional MerR regulator